MERKDRNITLLLTRGCNLDCTYCYERHKSPEMMSCETALRIVALELQKAEEEGGMTFHVTFMGGEPFLNFDVIKCVVEWLRNQTMSLRIETYATTNGTLVTGEIKDWLATNCDLLKVQISYDGDEFIQRINRTDMPIDMDFFLNTFPIQGVHITVSRDALPFLSKGVTRMLARGARCSTNLAIGTKWSDEDAQIYLRELRTLAEGYLTKFLDKEPIPALSRTLGLVGSKSCPMPSCRDCVDYIAYDVDGTVYPCHLFSPIVCGKKRAVKLKAFECDEALKQFGGKSDSSCKECILYNWCPACYGFNYLLTGSTGTRDHSTCKMMFAQALAASEYQIRYFSKVGVTEATASKAKAAIHAYRILRRRNVTNNLQRVYGNTCCPTDVKNLNQ